MRDMVLLYKDNSEPKRIAFRLEKFRNGDKIVSPSFCL